MDLDLATRRKICQLVAGIITVDAKLDAKEAAFVYRLMQGFGIDAREPLVPLVDSDSASDLMLELPRDAQDAALGLLVDAACIDGRIDQQERSYLRAIGAALSIADEDIERRIVGRLMNR